MEQLQEAYAATGEDCELVPDQLHSSWPALAAGSQEPEQPRPGSCWMEYAASIEQEQAQGEAEVRMECCCVKCVCLEVEPCLGSRWMEYAASAEQEQGDAQVCSVV